MVMDVLSLTNDAFSKTKISFKKKNFAVKKN